MAAIRLVLQHSRILHHVSPSNAAAEISLTLLDLSVTLTAIPASNSKPPSS
jgi:hypothetical protein